MELEPSRAGASMKEEEALERKKRKVKEKNGGIITVFGWRF